MNFSVLKVKTQIQVPSTAEAGVWLVSQAVKLQSDGAAELKHPGTIHFFSSLIVAKNAAHWFVCVSGSWAAHLGELQTKDLSTLDFICLQFSTCDGLLELIPVFLTSSRVPHSHVNKHAGFSVWTAAEGDNNVVRFVCLYLYLLPLRYYFCSDLTSERCTRTNSSSVETQTASISSTLSLTSPVSKRSNPEPDAVCAKRI